MLPPDGRSRDAEGPVRSDGPVKRQPPGSPDPGIPVDHGREDVKLSEQRHGAEMAFGDVTVTVHDDFVATVEVHRPPNNFFDVALIQSLADAYEALDLRDECRAIVLCSEGKHFCAGAKLT